MKITIATLDTLIRSSGTFESQLDFDFAYNTAKLHRGNSDLKITIITGLSSYSTTKFDNSMAYYYLRVEYWINYLEGIE